MSFITDGSSLDLKLQRRDRARLRSAMIWGYELSKDPNRKLGAILVHQDDRQSSLGYNGLATGIPDNEENWKRPLKYELVIHSEMNALDNRSFPAIGGTLFCLLKPCHICLNRLINNRLSRIVWLKQEVDFINNHEDIWNMLAERFIAVRGGYLIEYEREPLDMQLEALYNAKHDGYRIDVDVAQEEGDHTVFEYSCKCGCGCNKRILDKKILAYKPICVTCQMICQRSL